MINITTLLVIYAMIAIIIWIVLIVDTRKTNIYDLLERKWLGLSIFALLAITMIAVCWILVAFVLAWRPVIYKK